MQQVLTSSVHPSLAVFAAFHSAINPASESERPTLGRRLPRFDGLMRAPSASGIRGARFIEHLCRATEKEPDRLRPNSPPHLLDAGSCDHHN